MFNLFSTKKLTPVFLCTVSNDLLDKLTKHPIHLLLLHCLCNILETNCERFNPTSRKSVTLVFKL